MEISFTDPNFVPVELPDGAPLAEHLTIQNSPILFGCRTGICGTCLVSVTDLSFDLEGPTPEEREVLEMIAPDDHHLRLACQLKMKGNGRLTREEEL